MNSYNLLSIKTCNFLLLSFKTVVTRKIWEIYEVKDLALSMRKFSANAILKQYSDQRETTGDTWNTPKKCFFLTERGRKRVKEWRDATFTKE